MCVGLAPDSLNHFLVRREPGWPDTDAGGVGGIGYFVVVQALLCQVGEHHHRLAHQCSHEKWDRLISPTLNLPKFMSFHLLNK